MSTNLNSNNGGRKANVLFVDQLDEEIKRRQHELDALIHARSVLRGSVADLQIKTVTTTPLTKTQTGISSPVTVSEGVEALLQTAPGHEMHLDDIHKRLRTDYAIQITRKNLANTLNRWLSRGKKFERTDTNTYGLL